MKPKKDIQGSLYSIITNADGLYEGNLIKYFQIVFYNAKNVHKPYHNFRHMMHVVWLCHNACNFYSKTLNKREMRNLLVAAMFHDFDHTGKLVEDTQNIAIALEGLNKYILPEDKPFLQDIEYLIKATQYPYKTPSSELTLSGQIIRDADLSQALNPTWLQQVVFGLAAEWKKTPLEVLKGQGAFHQSFKFATGWAQKLWPQELIEEKIDEATKLLEILEMKDT